jgi:polyhydroxybutyrate depolymerase
VVLHGGGGRKDLVSAIRTLTRFDAKADREGALVLYPEAVDNYWNDGRGLSRYRSQAENVDDAGFIAALIGHVAQSTPIDRRRVYVTGASNGAMMAYRLACTQPDRFAAIAAVAGNLPARLECAPTRPTPVLIINGTADPLMPWKGGEVRAGAQRLGQVLSAPATADRWAAINRCDRPTEVPRDGTRVFRRDFGRCAAGSAVVVYRVEGGGHTWPGGPQQTAPALVGRTSRDLNATDVIWDFFSSHVRADPGSGYDHNAMEPPAS